MQHAVLAARTIITAQSDESQRAALLAYIGASYGVGFALGPAAGGWLSSISLETTAWAAAGGSLLALAIVALGLQAGRLPGVRLLWQARAGQGLLWLVGGGSAASVLNQAYSSLQACIAAFGAAVLYGAICAMSAYDCWY